MSSQTITIAAEANLVDAYNKSWGSFFSSGAGLAIGVFMSVAAVTLLILLIVALIMKAFGRQNGFVSMFAAGGVRIVIVLLVVFFLASPYVTLPILLNLFQLIVNGLGNTTSDLIQNAG